MWSDFCEARKKSAALRIIRGVIVRMDGQLVSDWVQAFEKILGTGRERDCGELPER